MRYQPHAEQMCVTASVMHGTEVKILRHGTGGFFSDAFEMYCDVR